MTTVYVIETHDQLLDLWREQEQSALRVTHLDFHCDMRGLLIDRWLGTARRIPDRFPEPDQGNFLTHAILDGHVASVRWVYDTPGGRAWDVGTVKYATDFSARRWRKVSAEGSVPLKYEHTTFALWEGLQDEDWLDIDWDVFASTEYTYDSIATRANQFFKYNLRWKPQHISVCYSSGYSHPSRNEFKRFIGRIADYFSAEIITLPRPSRAAIQSQLSLLPAPLHSAIRSGNRRSQRFLRRMGIY